MSKPAALVTHPVLRSAHTRGRIEVLDFIEDQQLDFCAGNVLKYLCRYRYRHKYFLRA